MSATTTPTTSTAFTAERIANRELNGYETLVAIPLSRAPADDPRRGALSATHHHHSTEGNPA